MQHYLEITKQWQLLHFSVWQHTANGVKANRQTRSGTLPVMDWFPQSPDLKITAAVWDHVDGQWRKRQKHPNNPSGSQDIFPKTTCIVITNFPAVGSITSYIILSFDQFRLLKSGLKFKSSEVCQSQLHWKPLVSCQLPPITHNSLYIQFIYVLQASVFLMAQRFLPGCHCSPYTHISIENRPFVPIPHHHFETLTIQGCKGQIIHCLHLFKESNQ